MAKWSDLPVELKRKIVNELKRESEPEATGAYPDVLTSTELASALKARQALVALNGVDKVLYELAGPIVWKIVYISERSLDSVERFKAVVPEQRRALVGDVHCVRRDQLGERRRAAQICVEILKLAPNAKRLGFAGCATSLASALRSQPAVASRLCYLQIMWSSCAITKATDNAYLLSVLPRLQTLILPRNNDDGSQELLTAVRGLHHLREFHSGGWYTMERLDFSLPWSASLSYLRLEFTLEQPTLRGLLNGIGSNLSKFDLLRIPYTLDTFDLARAPFHAPSLLHLGLFGVEEYKVDICTAFRTSPLESIWIALDGDWTEEGFAQLGRKIGEWKASLKVVEVRLQAPFFFCEGVSVLQPLKDSCSRLGMKLIVRGETKQRGDFPYC